jgi:hypothetical protein
MFSTGTDKHNMLQDNVRNWNEEQDSVLPINAWPPLTRNETRDNLWWQLAMQTMVSRNLIAEA